MRNGSPAKGHPRWNGRVRTGAVKIAFMAELVPARFGDLVTRLFLEPERQDALFELPRRKWHGPRGEQPDLSVRFHGKRAGNPAGPAAGPHTQMAQNLLLSYAAGARILELKTVQVNDRLTIGRPCIDMTNVGYNIEWSQELLVEQSVREYAAGAMLIEMFRRHVAPASGARTGEDGGSERALSAGRGIGDEYLLDVSVGYDLAGIRSEKIRWFLEEMRDAKRSVEALRREIPAAFTAARDDSYPMRLSESITLSTFHGCPVDEIERICEHLIGECDFDVMVKMNPPTLGRDKLEHLLHDVLGYTELTVNPKAYASVISLGDSVELCRRLTSYAGVRGRRVGFKFSNTLEVMNHRRFFPTGNPVMYLSGEPLHVITMALTDEFRRAVGPHVPISFSAGITARNFGLAAACGFVPVTVSTDLLRPGGYGRITTYVEALAASMRTLGANDMDEYIVRFAERHLPAGASRAWDGVPRTEAVARAAAFNTGVVAGMARDEPRYRADRNRGVPKRIDSHLTTFDCITCDKCLPVCPNAANFTYRTEPTAFEYCDLIVCAKGTIRPGEARRFEIQEAMQIACYADFCNECGNCDTFCPEYGGPYIKKPTFFGSKETWMRAGRRDGFVVSADDRGAWIEGRIKGERYVLRREANGERIEFEAAGVLIAFDARHEPLGYCGALEAGEERRIDMWAYHVMRHLLVGVLDARRINQVNAAYAR